MPKLHPSDLTDINKSISVQVAYGLPHGKYFNKEHRMAVTAERRTTIPVPIRNRTVFRPARSVFTDRRLTSIGFVGHDGQHNPGLPSGDPDWQKGLVEEFGHSRIYYAENNHQGRIAHLGDTGIIRGQDFAINRLHELKPISISADAIIIDYSEGGDATTPVARTWDCAELIFVNTHDQRLGLVHGSINSLVGYKVDDFHGPIIDRALEYMGDLKHLHVACGPCMGGLVSTHAQCWCYEFGSRDTETLFKQVLALYPNLSVEGLMRHREQDGKIDIAFGELVVRILQYLGLTRKGQVDTSCNFCTGCHHQFYSNRRVRQRIDQLEVKQRNHPLSNEEIAELADHQRHLIARYGNLAYATVSAR